MTVWLLVNLQGVTIKVMISELSAKTLANKYNADPFLEQGVPDPHAPYHIEHWEVS